MILDRGIRERPVTRPLNPWNSHGGIPCVVGAGGDGVEENVPTALRFVAATCYDWT
jgi:hypothetical protein